MIRRVVCTCAATLGVLVCLGVPGAQARTVEPPHAGQVGLGLQGQFGTLLQSGDLGTDFGSGGGVAVRLRYRMRYERAIGLSFESQRFEARSPADTLGTLLRTSAVFSGLDFYQLFGTRTVTHKMLSIGLGIAQFSQEAKDAGTVFPGDGIYVSVGAGVERFFWQSWAFDLSTRYMTVFESGTTNHDFQASLGLIFYASY